LGFVTHLNEQAGQQIKSDLSVHHPKVSDHFYVNVPDRKYQYIKINCRFVKKKGSGLYPFFEKEKYHLGVCVNF